MSQDREVTMGAGDNPSGKGFSKLIEEFNNTKKEERRAKHNRTLSLDVKNFLELQQYCKERNLSVSDVIDRLIAEFLEALLKHTPGMDEKKPA